MGQATDYEWAAACNELLEEDRADRIELLEYAARQLHAALPEVAYLTTLVAWFDAMPRRPSPLAFCDNPAAEIQIVRRDDCETVLLCFCARNSTLGLPLNFSHQWLGRLPVSLIYIKDYFDIAGACGYPSLGSGSSLAIAGLKRLTKELGARRTYALGVSHGGGYAALYYGLQLEIRGVLGLAAATDLTPAFLERVGRVTPIYRNVLEQAPEYAQNLFEVYDGNQSKPRVLLAFSADNFHDRQQAERMGGLPNVELVAVTGSAHHNVVDPLIRQGRYLPLLERLLSEQ